MRILSMYWNNVDGEFVRLQREVFAKLGYTIEQQERTGMAHGLWLDEMLQAAAPDEILLIVDIDCIALNADIIERARAAAQAGKLFGCAQVANYLQDRSVYAAPMFMSLSKTTWERMGRPSAQSNAQQDVAQSLSRVAHERGIAIELLQPTASLIPMWQLDRERLFGIGTFYEGGVMHLFQSRHDRYTPLFRAICEDVLSGCYAGPHRYLPLAQRLELRAGLRRAWKAFWRFQWLSRPSAP